MSGQLERVRRRVRRRARSRDRRLDDPRAFRKGGASPGSPRCSASRSPLRCSGQAANGTSSDQPATSSSGSKDSAFMIGRPSGWASRGRSYETRLRFRQVAEMTATVPPWSSASIG
jgi:hypothetical protein